MVLKNVTVRQRLLYCAVIIRNQSTALSNHRFHFGHLQPVAEPTNRIYANKIGP